MNFNKLIPELSVFDISQTKDFYKKLGFKIEYERAEENIVFMSFEDSLFMFEQIHDIGWNTGALEYPLGRGINLSITVENVEALYETVKNGQMDIYRELTKSTYLVNGVAEEPIEFLIQDPNGYLLRFTS